MTVNKDAWQKLLDEDREWLLKQPRALEREHIDLILKSAREVSPAAYERLVHPPTPTPITAEGLRAAGVVPIFAGGQERWAFGGNSNCWLTWSLNGGWRFYFGGHYIRRVKSIEDALGMVAAIRGPGE